MDELALPIPEDFLRSLENLVRRAVVDALTTERVAAGDGFLDVSGAAAYAASTPSGIRSLVKRRAIPFHKAPNGRILSIEASSTNGCVLADVDAPIRVRPLPIALKGVRERTAPRHGHPRASFRET
jgi:hypothetical protein